MNQLEEDKIKKLRVCKRCLLKELDLEEYNEKLHKYILKLDASIKTNDQEYDCRLQVCKECEKLHEGTCQACGCFVELRAAVKKSHCPYKKW